MAAPRRFDHEACHRLWAIGDYNVSELARLFGVTPQAVRRVLFPDVRRAMDARAKLYTLEHSGACEDCGTQTTGKNIYAKGARLDRIVCHRCAGRRAAEDALMRRMNEAGDLSCSVCGEHRPMTDFSIRPNGFPRSECRACATASRRRHRLLHPELAAAAIARQRERRRAKAAR